MMNPEGAARRVLVVEDEALVAMMIADILEDLGFHVVGPAANVTQALTLIEAEGPEAAVLDVNLGGEKVYPVAEALRSRGVPHLFLTGYGAAGVDPDFATVRILQKPVREQVLARAVAEILPDPREAPSGGSVPALPGSPADRVD